MTSFNIELIFVSRHIAPKSEIQMCDLNIELNDFSDVMISTNKRSIEQRMIILPD